MPDNPNQVSYTELADCACAGPQSGWGCDYSQLGYPTVKSEPWESLWKSKLCWH